jgi:hypothetical protein
MPRAQGCARGINASIHVIPCVEDPAVIEKILKHLKDKAVSNNSAQPPSGRAMHQAVDELLDVNVGRLRYLPVLDTPCDPEDGARGTPGGDESFLTIYPHCRTTAYSGPWRVKRLKLEHSPRTRILA